MPARTPTTTTWWQRWERVVVAGVVGTVVCGVVLVGSVWVTDAGSPDDPENHGYITLTYPPKDSFEAVLNKGDGQAYYALAQDPTLSRRDAFVSGASPSAYAQRPLLPYLLWLLSAGQRDWLPAVFVVVSALGAGLFLAVNTAFAQRRYPDVRPQAVLLFLALPGVISAFAFGPNLPSFALATLGLLFWVDERPRRVWAVVCFVVAILFRDTAAIVPLTLAVHHLVTRRRIDREIWLLASSIVPYLLWAAFVTARLGGLGGFAEKAFGPPFVGFVTSVPNWSGFEYFCFALGAALMIGGLRRDRSDIVMWTAVATVIVSVFMSSLVWSGWQNFSRVLLFAYYLPLFVLLSPRAVPSAVAK